MIKSIQFPEMFSRTVTNTVSGYEATLQNLKLLLLSNKMEMVGDPYFGTNLKRFLYTPNDQVLRDLVIDDIYAAIITFMPQITVERKDITVTSSRGSISVNIEAINNSNFKQETYSLVLLS